MNIALQFKWRDKSRVTNVVPGSNPSRIGLHGSKLRLELNGTGFGGFVNSVSIKGRGGLRAIGRPGARSSFVDERENRYGRSWQAPARMVPVFELRIPRCR